MRLNRTDMKNSADQGGFIHRGRRPRWITPSEICSILHILRKPNSIIALLFVQNVSSFLKEFHHYALCFPLTKYNTTLSPGFLGQRFNNLQLAAFLTSFWGHWFNNFRWAALLTLLIQYGKDSFQIWWIQGSDGSWKTWKVLEFYYGIFQDWNVLEKCHWSWKVLEICETHLKNMKCMEGSKEN